MQQIADWLKELGMSEYAQRFAENRIDLSVLPDLTDQHLEKLGVALGDRLKILRAIRELSATAVAVAQPATSAAPVVQDSVERRQLTVMFCDLVGSTPLSAKVDLEDLRSVIGAYHKCVAETVARFDGFVAKYMGDGVLVYFGYPHAHEDDAERAVRAGLALIEAIGKLRIQEPLQVRIGVATGLVVVGDIVGAGDAQERGVVGETPNLAARLQGSPRRIRWSSPKVRDGFSATCSNCRISGPRTSRASPGRCGPGRRCGRGPWRAVESRFEAMHATGLTALVGREEETELLLRRWSRAKSGEGQVVLLAGNGHDNQSADETRSRRNDRRRRG
jgi:class 3 adenylate cyclase